MQRINALSLRDITNCALFAALIVVLAQFSIPLPFSPVPFTGQVLGILLTIMVLERKVAFLAVFSYILLGAAGAPVFSMARGGLFMLLGPTGGYLWGFIPAVLIGGRIIEIKPKPSYFHATLAALCALLAVYLCGVTQLMIVLHYNLRQAFSLGVLPFIFFDIIKAYLAIVLGINIRKQLRG